MDKKVEKDIDDEDVKKDKEHDQKKGLSKMNKSAKKASGKAERTM